MSRPRARIFPPAISSGRRRTGAEVFPAATGWNLGGPEEGGASGALPVGARTKLQLVAVKCAFVLQAFFDSDRHLCRKTMPSGEIDGSIKAERLTMQKIPERFGSPLDVERGRARRVSPSGLIFEDIEGLGTQGFGITVEDRPGHELSAAVS
jgi:hypothetical protein